MMRIIANLGLFLTTGYFIALFLAILFNWSEFRNLRPNEWGDFIAGGLGPIAIFWLVLGFFQQGKEPSHSVDALNLQAEELRNSVEQQSKIANLTAQQLEVEREKFEEERQMRLMSERGRFLVMDAGCYVNLDNEVEQYVEVTNLGNSVASFGFYHGVGIVPGAMDSEFEDEPDMEYAIWEKFVGRRYTFRIQDSHEKNNSDLDLHYTNADGSIVGRSFRFNRNTDDFLKAHSLEEITVPSPKQTTVQ